MTIRRTVALALALVLAAGSTASLQAQAPQPGVLGGTGSDKAKQPYSDYSIRLRAADSRSVLRTTTMDSQGQFSFTGLALSQRYLVELFSMKDNKIVCTEGPFVLTAELASKTDVNIDCGRNPTAWLIAAGAGAALLAATTQSSSQ